MLLKHHDCCLCKISKHKQGLSPDGMIIKKIFLNKKEKKLLGLKS